MNIKQEKEIEIISSIVLMKYYKEAGIFGVELFILTGMLLFGVNPFLIIGFGLLSLIHFVSILIRLGNDIPRDKDFIINRNGVNKK